MNAPKKDSVIISLDAKGAGDPGDSNAGAKDSSGVCITYNTNISVLVLKVHIVSKTMEENSELVRNAKLMLEKSYSPYSHFRVGAAIRTKEGEIFTGTNIENASYGLSVCAERVALFKAVSEGHKSFTDLAIVSSSQMPTFPCGACRQVLYEFSPEIKIHLKCKENEIFQLTDLFPHPFKKESIDV